MGHSASLCKKKMSRKEQRKSGKRDRSSAGWKEEELRRNGRLWDRLNVSSAAPAANILKWIHLACINQEANELCIDIVI